MTSDPRSPRPQYPRPVSGVDRDRQPPKTPPAHIAAQIAGAPLATQYEDTQPHATIDERLVTISGRAKATTEGIEAANRKLDRIGDIEERLDGQDATLEAHGGKLDDHGERLIRLDTKVDTLLQFGTEERAARERREQRESDVEKARIQGAPERTKARGTAIAAVIVAIAAVVTAAGALIFHGGG